MARIDWAAMCDTAFLDDQQRLCVIGMIRDIPVDTLPVTLPHITLVARLADIQPVDEINVAVGMVTPSGERSARTGSGGVRIEMARDFVMATISNLDLTEEGVHYFQVRLRGQPILALPVEVQPRRHQPFPVQ